MGQSNPFEKIWLQEQAFEIVDEHISLFVVCSRVFYSKKEESFLRVHRHDFFELHYIIDGKLTVQSEDGQTISVEKNHFVIYAPNFVHKTVSVEPKTVKFVFGFYLDSRSSVLKEAIESMKNSTVSCFEASEQMRLMVTIMMNCSRGFNERNNIILFKTIETFMLEVIGFFDAHSEPDKPYSVSKDNQIVDLARKYIALNSNRALTVEEVASELGFSTRHLLRMVEKSTSRTVSDMIIDARISYIKELLHDRSLPVAQVAEKCDFADDSTFIKFFKRHVGSTPASYRKHLPQ